MAVDPPAVLGKTSKISVDVFNAGGATANYVVAEPYSEAAAKIIPEKVFIGTLEPDDFDSFTFQAQFKDGLPAGIQPLQIRLYYRDKGVRKELPNKTLTVNIYTQAEANALQKQELPVGPLVVLLVLGTFLFRKRLAKLLGSFGKKDAEA